MSRPNALRVVPEYGALAFGSVTGSIVSVLTTTKQPAGLLVSSWLAGATSGLELSVGGVVIAQLGSAALQPFMIDLASMGLTFAPGIIGIKHLGVAPTSGGISVAAFPMR